YMWTDSIAASINISMLNTLWLGRSLNTSRSCHPPANTTSCLTGIIAFETHNVFRQYLNFLARSQWPVYPNAAFGSGKTCMKFGSGRDVDGNRTEIPHRTSNASE